MTEIVNALEYVAVHSDREQLLLETIRAAAKAGHMRLLDELTDMLIKHNNPPHMVAGELTE